jgi:hypothetical protein
MYVEACTKADLCGRRVLDTYLQQAQEADTDPSPLRTLRVSLVNYNDGEAAHRYLVNKMCCDIESIKLNHLDSCSSMIAWTIESNARFLDDLNVRGRADTIREVLARAQAGLDTLQRHKEDMGMLWDATANCLTSYHSGHPNPIIRLGLPWVRSVWAGTAHDAGDGSCGSSPSVDGSVSSVDGGCSGGTVYHSFDSSEVCSGSTQYFSCRGSSAIDGFPDAVDCDMSRLGFVPCVQSTVCDMEIDG